MKQNIFSLLLFLLTSNFSFAQREYFVEVTSSTCTYNIIDSIPAVKWVALGQSTFDKTNKRYIFRGQDTSNNYKLYSIDVTNASVIFNPLFPSGHQFGNIRFDNSSGILYGLHWVGASTSVDFISINTSNFNYTSIGTINNLSGQSNDATVDEINHRLIFSADDGSNHCLFSVDATGNVVSKPQFPTGESFRGFAFDNSSGILYGLRWSDTQPTVFVTINPANFNYTIIDTIPYHLTGGIAMGYPTFDEANKRYTFAADDSNNNRHLYTVDATNAQVISSPSFPTFTVPHNLIETKYDNSSGKLYALHFGHDSELTSVEEPRTDAETTLTLFPNPSPGVFTVISLEKVIGIEVFNVMGERMIIGDRRIGNSQQMNNSNSYSFPIDLSSQPEGVYFVHIRTGRGFVAKKIIINK